MEGPTFTLQQEAMKYRIIQESLRYTDIYNMNLIQMKYVPLLHFQTTHQFEDFEEVEVSVEDVLDLLQPLLAQGTHGVADPVEPHASGEDDEALEQGLAAGYVFQLQVRDTVGKLENMKRKGKGGMLGFSVGYV